MAASDVFMDTAGFLALWDASDQHHGRAVQLQSQLSRKKRQFLTTDYIVDETATLLIMRHSHAAAADFLKTTLESRTCVWNRLIPTDSMLLQSYFIVTATNSGPSRIASASR